MRIQLYRAKARVGLGMFKELVQDLKQYQINFEKLGQDKKGKPKDQKNFKEAGQCLAQLWLGPVFASALGASRQL
jgi:hypothetical protein